VRIAGARVCVTGGHGFIGRAVVTQLAAAGAAEILVPYRPGTEPVASLPGVHVEADVRDADSVGRVAAGCDLVVHLAARSGGIAFQRDGTASGQAGVLAENHAMTQSVLAAAAAGGVRRVFLASSAVVYRGEGALDEDAPLVTPGDGSVTGYAWSKLTDEALGSWYARAGAIEVVIGRFGNVYGPGGPRSTVVHALVTRALSAPRGGTLVVWGDGSAVRSFVHVDDAARAVLGLLERGESGAVYNIDNSQPVTIERLAVTICDVVGRQLSVQFDHSKPTGPRHRVPDASRIRRLGFAPLVPFDQGIERTVAAFRETMVD